MKKEEIQILMNEEYPDAKQIVSEYNHIAYMIDNIIIEWRKPFNYILSSFEVIIIYPTPDDIKNTYYDNLIELLTKYDKEVTQEQINHYKQCRRLSQNKRKNFPLNYYYFWKWGIIDGLAYYQNLVPKKDVLREKLNKDNYTTTNPIVNGLDNTMLF